MYNPIGGSTQAQQQRRQASARHPQIHLQSENRTASHSASRQQQQQSSNNLHLISRPAPPGHQPKKMKLIRTRAPAGTSVTSNEKKQRISSPSAATGPSLGNSRNKVSQGRQQNLNLSSNQFLKQPTGPQTAKNQSSSSYRQQQSQQPAPMQDHFLFSASSPPVQINKQAIMMNSQNVQQNGATRPIQGKQKESLGHITASRRQKQTGLQINVDGCQSIVINQPSRGHVIGSSAAKTTTNGTVPDNQLFYGSNQPKAAMSPQHQHASSHMESLNQMPAQNSVNSPADQSRRQQQSSMSKKHLRQKVVTTAGGADPNATYDASKVKNSQVGLQSYQITPKGAGQFSQIAFMAPRSTKARTSQHYVKGRFIEQQQHQKASEIHSPKHAGAVMVDGSAPLSPSQQPMMSTLEQQQKQQMQKGFSPARPEDLMGASEGPPPGDSQMLFMQSPPPPPRRGSNRLVSPTHNPRASAHSNFNNRGSKQQSAKGGASKHQNPGANNSSLGFKTASHGGTLSQTNTLKIQNMRVYNETAGVVSSKVTPASTKHETQQQRYAMRNNFISPSMVESSGARPIGFASPPDRKEQIARHGGGSNLRQFSNTSNSSNMVSQSTGTASKQPSKKRKLTYQRATISKNVNGSLNNSGVMGIGGNTTMRPLSGAVKGSRGVQSYSLRANEAYNNAMSSTNPFTAPGSVNVSQRQSTTAARGKNIQILSTEMESQQTRVYSPNAAMNGRRDINQELQNLAVPQFYPSTTTNQSAPRQINFTHPSTTTTQTMTHVHQVNMSSPVAPQSQNNNLSSACLMDEPELVCEEMPASKHHQQVSVQEQLNTSKNLMSSSNLSMQQPAHQFNSQQAVVSSRQPSQSRQLQELSKCNTGGSGSEVQFSKENSSLHQHHSSHATAYEPRKSENNQSHKLTDHSRQTIIVESGSGSEQHHEQHVTQRMSLNELHQQPQYHYQQIQRPPELQGHDITGPLVIPNFAVNLPQSTTAATAPKISADNMMIVSLDPISKNSKDINQKIQQRKVESARRPADAQPQAAISTKPSNNLQVVVTHEINPVVNLANTTGFKQAQTTTNANLGKSAVVPSLNFTAPQQPPQQASKQNQKRQTTDQSEVSSHRPSQRQFESRQKRQQSHQSTQRSNPQSHRSGHNDSFQTGAANGPRRVASNVRASKQSQQSPGKGRQPSAKTLHHSQPTGNLKQPREGSATQHNQQSSQSNPYNQQIKFPMTPAKCLKLFGSRHLTEYEKTEILDFPQVYYFGEGVKKIQAQRPPQSTTSPSHGNRDSSKNRQASREEEEDTNCGYDDSKGNYRVVMKDHIAYRYEMVEHLGRGSFGVAIKCFDHKTQDFVALKIIKNKKKYYYQAGVELKILQFLKDNDPDDTMNIIHMKDYVIFRKHLCITFELMSINLYEFLKLNDFEGLSLSLVRRFAIQLLYSLKFLKENDVIHCDLKPENILLKDPSKSGIKIIDFGSSCFQDERVYTYIQSRFYRAPEIILGIPYTPCIDMWSFGCIMAEFAMGYPIFPGEDETDQISLIMEVCGIPAPEVLAKGQRKTKFFNESNMPRLAPNSHGKIRKPGTKVLDDILECSDQSFVNFVERCLEWDPEKRMTPDEAIRHQWILEGLPPKVLVHHQKLHSIATKSLPQHIREQRAEYLATQPLDVQLEFRDDDEDEDDTSSASYRHHSTRQHRGNAHNQKSKSLERTAAQGNFGANHQSSGGGNPSSGQAFVARNRPHNSTNAQQNQQQASRNHRQSQSYDNTSGYRHSNVSANVNAQQHHNLRQKKQVGVLKSSAGAGGDSKPTVEQMLHASQQRQ